MHTVLDNFAKSVGAGGDDGQTSRERFETGVRKRIVKSWEQENIGRWIKRRQVANRTEPGNKTAAHKTPPAPGDEKAKLSA
jgi:hypothetical protein